MRLAARTTWAAGCLLLLSSLSVASDCMQGHAVYSTGEGTTTVAFSPSQIGSVVLSNKFELRFEDRPVLDGVVMWTDEIPRSTGMLMHDCPEGDVTGAEIEACTAWQGVIYAVDEQGTVTLLPAEDEPAAGQLIFPDLAWTLNGRAAIETALKSAMQWDVFRLTGCVD